MTPLRLLADIPRVVVEAVRGMGHDVAWMMEGAAGVPDDVVLTRALAEGRTLLTLDHDFGEIAFRRGLPASCGVILVRMNSRDPGVLAAAVVAALGTLPDWAGHFSVLEPGRIRRVRLPD